MLTIILNIIGLLCIIVSLVYINKTSKEEKNLYEEIVLINKDIKYYFHSIEEILNSFDELLENSLYKFETMEIENSIISNNVESEELFYRKNNTSEQNKKDSLESSIIEKNKVYNGNEEIFELKKMGLSNEEIAKKLNKGIREVDIIIKIWSSINKNIN